MMNPINNEKVFFEETLPTVSFVVAEVHSEHRLSHKKVRRLATFAIPGIGTKTNTR